MRRLEIFALAISAALASLLEARGAAAFCRSSACMPAEPGGSTQGQICSPAGPGDCGFPLQWRQPCIGFNVAEAASNQIDYDTTDALLQQAFGAWMAVDCGGGGPSIQVFALGSVSCTNIEYNQKAGNTNMLVYRDDLWPHD